MQYLISQNLSLSHCYILVSKNPGRRFRAIPFDEKSGSSAKRYTNHEKLNEDNTIEIK